jgi:CheY-like chemotaxis protein
MLEGLPVLIVDDSNTNRRILQEMVRGWKMTTTLTEGGPEALTASQLAEAQRAPLALILLDGQMPVMDGFTVAEKIKLAAPRSRTSIIKLTSSGMRGAAARCQEIGIDAYLNKPVKWSDLFQAIKLVLGSETPAEQHPPVITMHSIKEIRGRLNILVAEDNPVNQALAKRLLQKRGHQVTIVGNGRLALEALEKQSPDLILMDVLMPELDGFQATAAIREGERVTGKHMPIIALTASAMTGDREQCYAPGMDGYVSKLLRAENLFSVIEEVLSKHQKKS